MIALDTNILVYAHREESPFHGRAMACVMELAQAAAPWAIPWPCIHEFVAIVTHPRIYNPPTPIAKALDQVDAWLESPTVTMLSEAAGYWPKLRSLLEGGRIAGGQVHDARIVALCRQHGVRTLWSADRDFNRFARIDVFNPLIA